MSSTIARRTVVLAAAAAAFAAMPVAGAGAAGGAQAEFRDGTVLVGYEAGTSADRKRAIRRATGASDTRALGAGAHALRVPAGT